MDSFTIKRGATSPAIARSFATESGPLAIPEGTAVVFSMASCLGGPLIIDRQRCTVRGNEVIYHWQDGNTDLDGVFIGEFRISRLDDTEEIVPSGGSSPQDAFVQINITRSL